MRSVLRHIAAAKRTYAAEPFFEFLRDGSCAPRDRLRFVPCMAPFIMDFGDLNRYILRDESSTDPLQQLVNAHSREDDHHWPWYLDDLALLGHDGPRRPTDVLRDLYSDRMAVGRLLAGRLARLVEVASPLERLIIVEAIEETGNVLFDLTASLARHVERDEGIVLRYLGDFHLALESGHSRDGDDHRTLAAIVLDDSGRARAEALVDEVFALFAAWVGELLAYAREELAGPAEAAA
jgi:hypothetical protein